MGSLGGERAYGKEWEEISLKKIVSVILTLTMAAGVLGLAGCSCDSAAVENADLVYQVSLLQALTAGEYDGVLSVEELKQHGNIGIGTFDGVNGELIQLDGEVYQALWDGSVVVAEQDETVPFATTAYFEADVTEKDATAEDLEALKDILNGMVEKNGSNQFFFVKAKGNCSDMVVRSELKQEKPYKALDEVMKTDQREYEYQNQSGTIVGIYFPEYMSQLNTPGWHFHFLSDDKSRGGHILSLKGFRGDISVSEMNQFVMYCPDTDSFNEAALAEDQSERIQKVEQGGQN